MRENKYSGQVFINCPFDKNYRKIFRSIVFTILDCGFVPRCSLEIDDALEFRLRAIVKLIEQCKYGIHDLSRVELDTKSNLPRFNMPFELGIFYGAKAFGQGLHKAKICIILEKRKYRYQKFISDLSGVGITAHNDIIKNTTKAIRDWLLTASRRKTIPDGLLIYSRYRKFQIAITNGCKSEGVDYDTMPFVELTDNMSHWLEINQKVPPRLFD